jgi:signal transduction histidine kinase
MNSQTSSLSPQQLESQIVVAAAVEPNARVLQQIIATELPEKTYMVSESIDRVYKAIEAEAALVVITEEVLASPQVLGQLCTCLKQQPDWSDIPVIILLESCETFPTCLSLLHQTELSSNVILLEMPIKPEIFLSVVKSSLRNRQRQYALRDALKCLGESNQILEDFAHTAAHELRNPLGVVQSSLQFLQSHRLSPEKQQHLLGMATRTAKEMSQTLAVLLDYGRLKTLDSQDFTQVDMRKVVIQAQDGIQEVISQRGAEITWQELPKVWGQEQLLVQLVRNLIKNAIVHNPRESPKVEISAQSQGEKWRFFVRDNGAGIAPEDQQRIFMMFEQANKKKEKGSGIGLAFCRRVVEKHQGVIGVESELGRGSTFYFDLLKGKS